MIRTCTHLASHKARFHTIAQSRLAFSKTNAHSPNSLIRNKLKQFQRMGASWSSISNKERTDFILWTSIDSLPTTKFYDPFEVSVGLSEPATRRLRDGGIWRVDFEVDVAHVQKRLELYVQTTDASPVQRLTVDGQYFRRMVENNAISTDELCNVCAMHFRLEANGQELAAFCLVADIFRGGMDDCDISELSRKVYGTTKQQVPKRLI